MRTVICWFSGTGNSLWVAQTLAGRLPDAVLVPIAEPGSELSGGPQQLGLVFPVYAWGPPAVVARFIDQLAVAGNPSVFAVVTFGGHPGGALQVTRRLLQRRGLRLQAGHGVRMPENYPPFGGAPGAEKQKTILQAAESKVAEIAGKLQDLPHGKVGGGVLSGMFSAVANPLFVRSLPKTDRKFAADAKCNRCGLCARICPVGNIELADGIPRWLGRCEQCFACFHWCPQQAIQYGRRTGSQVRYHHPSCTAAQLLGRSGKR